MRKQLKEFFALKYRNEDWFFEPDFHNLRLHRFSVPVRPQFEEGNRLYVHHEAIDLHIDCIAGVRESDLPVCSIPLLDLEFDFHKSDDLKKIAIEHVRGRLNRMQPSELVRFQPPAELKLEEIIVQVKPRSQSVRPEDIVPTLATIGLPMGGKQFRGRLSRAMLREDDVRELVQKLRDEKASVILVGERGVGKTSILVDAVRDIEREAAREKSRHELRQTHWHTSAPRLIAGMQYLGQWQERLEQVIAELARIEGMLCVSNITGLIETGGREPNESLAAFLMTYLQSGELRMVCEATPEELVAGRRLLPGFEDCFQQQHVQKFDDVAAIDILGRIVTARSREMRIPAAADLTTTVYRMHKRFLPYRAFPGSSVPFLDSVFENATRERATEVTAGLARTEFALQTGLSETFLRDDLPLDPDDVIGRVDVSCYRPGRSLPAGHRHDRRFQVGGERPGPADRRAVVLRADRRRQNRTRQSDRRVALR